MNKRQQKETNKQTKKQRAKKQINLRKIENKRGKKEEMLVRCSWVIDVEDLAAR